LTEPYKLARAGLVKNFTGIDSVYEVPKNPDITLNSSEKSPETLADQMLAYLEREDYI
jgi:adenylylsulfate kinase-like enzyme